MTSTKIAEVVPRCIIEYYKRKRDLAITRYKITRQRQETGLWPLIPLPKESDEPPPTQ